MAGLQRHAVEPQLVGEPGDAQCRMAQNAGGDAGLLDLGILVHDAADPAQVDVHRPDRAAADGDAGGGAVVGDGIADLARVLQTRIDDLDGRHHVFGGTQHVEEADSRTFQRFAEDEGQLDLDPRPAIILMRDLGTVGDHHVIKQVAIVRLVDLRGALHRLGGEADLVADQRGAGLDLAVGHLGGDGIGVLNRDAGKGRGELDRLFALLFRIHQDIGGFVAIGGG
jgi:hypothetical protein